MPRLVVVSAIALTIGAAFALYGLAMETRRLEIAVQSRDREADRLESDIAVLFAERAYLARPQRIEALARDLHPDLTSPRTAGAFGALPAPAAAPVADAASR
jgi:cell division protein FtsL